MTIQVYGIPNCGTCKKALQWLEANQVTYEFIDYKKNPPNKELLESWVKSLGSKKMRNTSGKSYRALGEIRNTWDDQAWIEAFSQDPMLIKRPLLVKDGEAILTGWRAKEETLKNLLLS